MKLGDAWGDYDTYTGKVSDIARQLGFAGVAIIWLFKIDNGSGYRIEPALIIPLILIVIALFSDMVQYLLGVRIIKKFAEEHETPESKLEDEIGQIEIRRLRPMKLAFNVKVVCIFIAYGIILTFLLFHLSVV